MKSTLLLESHLKTLKLPTMLREYAKVSNRCSESNDPYESFLERLSELEVAARHEKSIERRLKQAGFPATKELADFDFTAAAKLNKQRILELATGDFIEQKANVVLVGPPGLGKTHLAIAIAREACRRGQRVKFFTAAALVNTYLEAREQRQVLRLESHIRNRDLIVVDELGYIPFNRTGSENLFSFFSQCYEQTSLLVTTNLPFADWPQTFSGDERLAGALLDRLTHRVHVIEVAGESYRLTASLKSKKGAASQRKTRS